jgi:hypothetical protein
VSLQGEGEGTRAGAQVDDHLGVAHHLGSNLVETLGLGSRNEDTLVDQQVEGAKRRRPFDVLERFPSEAAGYQVLERMPISCHRFESAQLMWGDLIHVQTWSLPDILRETSVPG